MHIVWPAVVAGGGRCLIPKCSHRVGRVAVPYAALFIPVAEVCVLGLVFKTY